MKPARIPKNKKEIARPKKEWVEFGFGRGRMRDASWARTEEQLKQAALSLAMTVKDKTNIVEMFPHTHQQYWYMIQALKKILEIEESTLLNDLFNLGVSVPEIFAWDRMYKPSSKKKTSRKKK